MQVRTQLAACISALTLVIVVCAALLVWNAQRSSYNHQRSSLAYQELGSYLQLAGDTFRIFKRIRRDLMHANGALTFDLDKAQSELDVLNTEISRLAIAEAETGYRSGEVPQDAERIESIKTQLRVAFSEVRQASELLKHGHVFDAHALLGKSLERRIDGAVSDLIESAILDEREELRQALEEIELIDEINLWSAAIVAIIGLILAALVIYTLVWRLGSELQHLEDGAKTFASGELDHEIPVVGRNELAMLASSFNAMARQLLRQRRELEKAHASLERRVQERTNELNTANAKLNQLDRTRKQFFADIGHELRSPITSVRGEAEVALRSRRGQRAAYKAALTRIVDISDQLTRFVNDIFLIAREQSGVADMRCTRTDFKKPVLAAIDQMRTMLDEHKAILTTEFPNETMLIEGDYQRLAQLVQTLLTNVVLHCPVGVEIRIVLERCNEDWMLRLQDNGPGIPSEHADLAFERFHRVPTTTSGGPKKGTGLGLPIARSIANAHGGRIWIDREYKDGTAVCVALPIIREHSRTDDYRGDGEQVETAA